MPINYFSFLGVLIFPLNHFSWSIKSLIPIHFKYSPKIKTIHSELRRSSFPQNKEMFFFGSPSKDIILVGTSQLPGGGNPPTGPGAWQSTALLPGPVSAVPGARALPTSPGF
jgi:hypothetical protein